MIIAIDFDGTIVEHRFPEIGPEVPGAFTWMKALQGLGAKLILWTVRSDMRAPARSAEGHAADRDYLREAVQYCRAGGVEFWAVNQNPDQARWTQSPKVYAHMYIDDLALGCPLVLVKGGRGYVNWELVGPRAAALAVASRSR